MSAYCCEPTPLIDDFFDAPTPPADIENLPDATPSRASTASLDDPMACEQGSAITGGSSVHGPLMASNRLESWWQEAHGFHGLPSTPSSVANHDPCWAFLFATLEALVSPSGYITPGYLTRGTPGDTPEVYSIGSGGSTNALAGNSDKQATEHLTPEAELSGTAGLSNCFTKEQINWIVEYQLRKRHAYYRRRCHMWEMAAEEFNGRFGTERSAKALHARFLREGRKAKHAAKYKGKRSERH